MKVRALQGLVSCAIFELFATTFQSREASRERTLKTRFDLCDAVSEPCDLRECPRGETHEEKQEHLTGVDSRQEVPSRC